MAPQKIVCSWCNAVMRDGTSPVSHGICPPCAAAMVKDMNDADAFRRYKADPVGQDPRH